MSLISRRLLAGLLFVSAAFASRPWTEEEFRRFELRPEPRWLPRPESLIPGPRRFNYLERVKLDCDFVARYQVADSNSPNFGGIIEAEHMPAVIETDNTQEAIWIWSRWFELTGRDDYRENIRRAWVYVLRHPAWREHSAPEYIWYSVWNCGLGFMAESKYRAAYGDSTFRSYADSCRRFFLANPLANLTTLDFMVTAQSSGMAYDYAVEMNDAVLRDSALARGNRVRREIESAPRSRLTRQNWAMCGGTMFWGVAHTFCLADTAAGRYWLETYVDSLPGFYPSGSWNCSHNIWLANAYRSAAELTGSRTCRLMHQYLTDTLLMRDTDRDGGIPATWTDPNTQDQTWVSTYLDFMGMDALVSPLFDTDVSALEFVSPHPQGIYVVGETIPVLVPLANAGRLDAADVLFSVEGSGHRDSVALPLLNFLAIDTLAFAPFVPTAPGLCSLDAVTATTGDANPLNDTSHIVFRVRDLYEVAGRLADTNTQQGIRARIKVFLAGAQSPWDSLDTDSSGIFSFRVIDTTVRITVEPEVPYFRRTWQITIQRDTTLLLLTPTAELMLVNNDSAGAFSGYYTSTLDSLGRTWCLWKRWADGQVPWHLFDRLRTPTLVWFTGNRRVGTVPPADRESLMQRAPVNLLLTGQNVAEDLDSTRFLADLCGVQFDSSGWAGFFAFGNRQDSLGMLIPGFSTAGGDGANNQTSRDILKPLRNGASILAVYDSVSHRGAAIRRLDVNTGTKVITLGFGFESVNRPGSRPGFFTRVQLMELMLAWFGLATGIEEQLPQLLTRSSAFAWPNPFTDRLSIALGTGHPTPSQRQLAISVADVSGRIVRNQHVGSYCSTISGLGPLPPGVYYVRISGRGGVLRVVKAR
uniref:T9SS type A sorting domain-containing protein n=1 Tax=candidate division WOR-3 bacterium TaxID=2052148 RepID=A0A7C4CB67_UNCW3